MILETMQIQVRTVPMRRGRWIAWTKPPTGRLDSIRTDPSGNVATEGGIARDSNGDVIVAFAMRFAHQDIIQAELDALFHGLQLCFAKNIVNLEIETDSDVARKFVMKQE